VSQETGLGDVLAVVVNYNAGEHLRRCVDSLRAGGVEHIVVVDNGSSDGSLASVMPGPGLQVEATGANLGYGKAANRGAEMASEGIRYLLISNPDLEVDASAVARLRARLEADPGIGIVGPSMYNPDGTLYPSAREFPDLIDAMGHGLLGQVWPANPFTRRYKLLDWDHQDSRAVDWVSGGCFLVRRQAWEQVGGFDPAYFMYLEDVDLCWRAGQAGWGVVYEPAARVVHVQGVSADRHPYRMLLAHHVSLWRFAWRSTTGSRRIALPVVAFGLVGRLGATAARRWAAGRQSDARQARSTGTSPAG
jgi:N-acetylglucosaminyl-diphospho-decaprenol L-rhamnosyltransferase